MGLNQMTLVREIEGPLAGRFVCLRRTLVTHGHWRRHWERDKGATISALPVMALLSVGRGVDGAECSTGRLAALSGISGRDLRSVRDSLRSGALIEMLPGASRGRWRFRPTTQLVSGGYERRFYFLGAMITSGTWSSLSCGQRNLLIVLAALAPSITREIDVDALLDALGPTGLPSVVEEFVEENAEPDVDWEDPIVKKGEGFPTWSIRRIYHASWTELCSLTGMPLPAIRDCVIPLLLSGADMLLLDISAHGMWYCLMEPLWGIEGAPLW